MANTRKIFCVLEIRYIYRYIYRYINKRQEITSLQTNRTIQSNKKEKRKWQTQGVPLRSRNSRFTYI